MDYRKFALVLVLPLVILLACTSRPPAESEKSQHGLRLSDFDFLKPGMSLDEIKSKLGEPDRDIGSGVFLLQYDLVDGRTVELMFVDLDNLLGAQVRDSDGTMIDLLEYQ